MTETISVIIPTLNEAAYLPALLDALSGQTHPPDEIIVADAGSTDGTVELAWARGARVVCGGMPAVGRNAGARAATGEVFLFLDADVLPRPEFIELALDEFTRAGYAVATCQVEALSDGLADQIIIEATNLYMQALQPISPRAPGFCIFARRAIHQAIGGFDESLRMSEDHDYARRAARCARFGMLTSVRIRVSMRRLEEEGLAELALKYLWCEMHVLAGKPVRSMPFAYEFGAHQPAAAGLRPMDVAELRAWLGRFNQAIHQHLSRAGLEQFQRSAKVSYDRVRSMSVKNGNLQWKRTASAPDATRPAFRQCAGQGPSPRETLRRTGEPGRNYSLFFISKFHFPIKDHLRHFSCENVEHYNCADYQKERTWQPAKSKNRA